MEAPLIAPAYWARAAERAAQSQAISLENALLNPRGSHARQAWLESARIDAERKRMYARFWDASMEAAA